MSKTIYDRLEPSDHIALKLAICYAAGDECAEGGRTPSNDCDCICCQAERLRRKLYPVAVPTMPLEEAIRVIEEDMLPTERNHWHECDLPRKHHYIALRSVLDTAKQAEGKGDE